MSASMVLAALDSSGCWPRPTSSGYSFRCPVPDHRRNDRRPSGRLGVGYDGTVLLWCGRGHSAEDIISAIGLDIAALFPDEDGSRRSRRPPFHVVTGGLTTKVPRKGRPELGEKFVAVYDYLNADERVIYRVG